MSYPKNPTKLLKIEELLNDFDNGKFDLPNVQRGFVWKPSQMENLWDSLLRGFPVGAIIVHAEEKDNKLQLLDGQQRVTSIAFGFADLKNKKAILRSSTANFRIFIDTRKPDEKEGRKYVFRVISRSHPWGYQHLDNAKPLTAADKDKAMDLWGENDPLAPGMLDKVYPYAVAAPLPLNIFTRAALEKKTPNVLKEELLAWVRRLNPDATTSTLAAWLENGKLSSSTDAGQRYSIDELYERITNLLNSYCLPMLPLSLEDDAWSAATNSAAELEQEEEQEEETRDAIEEVFVRLNSAGTPLSGEELNYSILKARMSNKLQEQIESACKGIMRPARFITLAYCLHKKSRNLRIKPKQFQREMKDEKAAGNFHGFIQKEILAGGLLENIKNILKYGDKMTGYEQSRSDYRLPYPLFLKIAEASRGEIIFILMYRLLYGNGNSDLKKFTYNTDEHRKMIGILLMFLWNGKDSKSGYDKLMRVIWRSVEILPFEKMWSAHIIGVAHEEEALKKFPADDDFFKELNEPRSNENFSKALQASGYQDFMDNVMGNKELLLWVQRKFLSSPLFKEELFELDDTSTPFDWDHISPDKLVRGKRNIPVPLKGIYQTPANFRAWPYRLNRADQDSPPGEKFDIKQVKKAEDIRDAIRGVLQTVNDQTINKYLLESSACGKEWLPYDGTWIQQNKISNEKLGYVYELILGRWKNMYNSLSKELCLKTLSKIHKKITLEKILKGTKEGKYNDESYIKWTIQLDNGACFYIHEQCSNNGVEYGFHEKEQDTVLRKEDFSEGAQFGPEIYDGVRYFYVYSMIACPSAEESYAELLDAVKKWLNGYKNKKIAKEINEKLEGSRK